MPEPAPYPKPSEIGGVLIRKVIALFKAQAYPLPFPSSVYIAVSGGSDSMVLAHLIATYGRKLSTREQITLIHFDHGWRAESAEHEKRLVQSLAERLQVGFQFFKLDGPRVHPESENLEEDGRLKRQTIYRKLVLRDPGSVILTGHHQTDAVESIFWRFLRGEFHEFRSGILFQDSECIRPFLQVMKEEILEYAQVEGIEFATDPTNTDPRFFRGWMRSEVFPMIENHFPGVRRALARYLTMTKVAPIDSSQDLTLAVQTVTGTSLNRAQRKALHELSQNLEMGGALSLPGGLQIRRTPEGFLIENLDGSHQ